MSATHTLQPPTPLNPHPVFPSLPNPSAQSITLPSHFQAYRTLPKPTVTPKWHPSLPCPLESARTDKYTRTRAHTTRLGGLLAATVGSTSRAPPSSRRPRPREQNDASPPRRTTFLSCPTLRLPVCAWQSTDTSIPRRVRARANTPFSHHLMLRQLPLFSGCI